MKSKRTIEQIIGNKETILGIILGTGVGYIGAALCFLTQYLLNPNDFYAPFFMTLAWGILLLTIWFRFIMEIQKRSLE